MKSIDLNGLWDISYSREAILTDCCRTVSPTPQDECSRVLGR